MAKTHAKSTKVAKKSKATTHADTCKHHANPGAVPCSSLTKAGKPCNRRVKPTSPSSFPTCGIHQSSLEQCQAIEECGQSCHRIAPYSEPYHFCTKHQDGSDTLPCHFMDLPTELRCEIYRHIFPAVIPYGESTRFHVDILRVNRQIKEEAYEILYGESKFHVCITPTRISLQGRYWDRPWTPGPYADGPKYTPIGEALCTEGAKCIRNLVVDISFNQDRYLRDLFGVRYYALQEYVLHVLRNIVRRLVELLPKEPTSSGAHLNHLTVNADMSIFFSSKPPSTRATPLFLTLEPFQAFPCVQYPPHLLVTTSPASVLNSEPLYLKLCDEWLMAVKSTTPIKVSTQAKEAKIMFGKVEQFVRQVYDRSFRLNMYSFAEQKNPSLTARVFNGIGILLHQARVAYDTEDLVLFNAIREAIKWRWLHRQRER
ncbi:hypothetical protein BDW02DRAFT_599188 [Decorospora gaudefroyi]|uniref:Uncharacterized protein n=1 Tax=Decorospora gaudefroyi TaxID=184978 RepID=A0A6A5KAI3_9PLEO|nr:hypothetical protein BDW02DRAFT_599188 [Decorospora gaudefroyi]